MLKGIIGKVNTFPGLEQGKRHGQARITGKTKVGEKLHRSPFFS